MKKILPMFYFSALAAAVSGLPAARAQADVKAGVDAWSTGNYDAAVKEWRILADRGDPDAQFNLAQAYKLGRGVPQDLDKAQELYRKAAAQGHLEAANVYGLLLFQNGRRQEAMPYIKASAGRGDPRAQYILGLAYFNGDLVEKDWVRAYALVSLANRAGLPQAAHALVQMDQHIALDDRQKSVILSSQIAADAEATRTRETTSADLASSHPITAPEIVAAEQAVGEATRATSAAGNPASAGADYARPAPAPAAKKVALPPPTPMKTLAPAAAKPVPAVAKAPAANASGSWHIQLGAFGVAGNAETLWAKIKARPELAGHDRMLVPAGRLTKLQAGGFATKAAADAACARLTAGGFTCLAVPG